MATNTTETKSTRGRKPTAKETTNNDAQIADLEAKNAEMQKQIEALMKMVQENSGSSDAQPQEILTEDEGVTVISLTPHKLNLCSEWGGGAVYTFNQMYETQEIDWADLKAIVRTNKEMVQKGRFYIANENAVKKLRLKSLYTHMLTPETLKGLFEQHPDKVIEMYNLAPEGQKESVIELVQEKQSQGVQIDANILQHLSKVSGKDLLNISKE